MANKQEDGLRPPPRVAPIKLDSLAHVRHELGRVYREARAGRIESQAATRFAYVLGQLKELIVCMDIEKRLNALEERGSSSGHK